MIEHGNEMGLLRVNDCQIMRFRNESDVILRLKQQERLQLIDNDVDVVRGQGQSGFIFAQGRGDC